MKKVILAGILLSAAASSMAMSAQGYEMMRQDCGFIAKVAVKAYSKAQRGEREVVPDDMKDDPMYQMALWAADFGSRASSSDEAGRMSAAKCIDNFERIQRDWRHGIATDPAQYR